MVVFLLTLKLIIMNKWKIRNNIVLFPKDWDKKQIMSWINAKYIRVCPICSKIDVSYNHFNFCNPNQERINKINREMSEKY